MNEEPPHCDDLGCVLIVLVTALWIYGLALIVRILFL